MIEISYANVMNGLNKGIHMRLLCPTRQETHYMFQRACELWYVKDFSKASQNPYQIDYNGVSMRFDNFEYTHNSSWRGFRGIFMIHPDITPENTMPRFQEMINEMDWHNERYLDQWRT